MTDYLEFKLAVSVKGVVRVDGRVVLCLNDRHQWELPGGRLESGEQPRVACARELMEETGLSVEVGSFALSTNVFEPIPGQHVLVLVYACQLLVSATPVASHEHVAVKLFTDDEVQALDNLPQLYKDAIAVSGT